MPEDESQEELKPLEEDPRRWQVRYKDGGGEQVIGESAEAVREARLKFWGDREIVFLEELKPVEP